MATNKKRKKVKKPSPPHMDGSALIRHTKTYLDACYATTRRIFQVVGGDASLFDTFTKRQKQFMFQVQVQPPRIQAMPGHKVPRQYIRYIQDELMVFLKKEYYDKEAGVTLMNMITIGLMLELMFSFDMFIEKLGAPQREVVERLSKAFEERNISSTIQRTISFHVKTSLMMISQPNFRIYGQSIKKYTPSSIDRFSLHPTIHIITHKCRSIRFNYRNHERKAFRVAMGQFLDTPYMGATIAMSRIFPNIKDDQLLNIYIQTHAIHRFKERINTFYPIMRNQFFVISLMMSQRVVRGTSGMQLIACIAPADGEEERTIGYFAFTIDGNNLLVLTLLPLLSESVPEGRILYERLHLSAGDLIYLGMDKLSFFYDVDIEQIPALKKVLFDELHLDYIRRDVFNNFRAPDAPFDEKKTLFVKNFFDKLQDQPADHAEVLNDLAKSDV
jgi:hypothetical protein